MKKTFITLLALAGVAMGAERTDLWQLTFGTGEGYTGGYKITNYTETNYAMSGQWDINGNTTNGYLATPGNKRVHTQWHNTGTGLFLTESFGIELVFSVPAGYNTYKHDCDSCSHDVYSLIKIATSDNSPNDLHFGPSADNGTFQFAGSFVANSEVSTPITLVEDKQYTAQLEVINGEVTLKIDGAIVQTGSLTDTATGEINQILLGGSFIMSQNHTADWIQENVYSVSAYKLTSSDNVPEPTTATLSLLALAGLCARRRRA